MPTLWRDSSNTRALVEESKNSPDNPWQSVRI